ncbi:MAG: hypothetical protein LBJ96_02210 [Holosporaceae bacterium]|jgi:hypothetical protein|nr:hypothetical protein [Holosporaceae bacterium]
MFRFFYVFGMFFFMASAFFAECMYGACVNMMNSTSEIVRLSYVRVEGGIGSIVKEESTREWNKKVLEIQGRGALLLVEDFPEFDQFAGTAEGKELVNIRVEYVDVVISVMALVCSMYCPNPFFTFRNIENKYGMSLVEEQPRGGGVTIFNIRHFSNRFF